MMLRFFPVPRRIQRHDAGAICVQSVGVCVIVRENQIPNWYLNYESIHSGRDNDVADMNTSQKFNSFYYPLFVVKNVRYSAYPLFSY